MHLTHTKNHSSSNKHGVPRSEQLWQPQQIDWNHKSDRQHPWQSQDAGKYSSQHSHCNRTETTTEMKGKPQSNPHSLKQRSTLHELYEQKTAKVIIRNPREYPDGDNVILHIELRTWRANETEYIVDHRSKLPFRQPTVKYTVWHSHVNHYFTSNSILPYYASNQTITKVLK